SSQIRRSSKNPSLDFAFGHLKGALYTTAPVSDQDYSLRPNRHIINTLPPPSAAIY
ncbi:hypothetical protein DL95DRAFT_313872, partial [Leptodontidium sp. 2 PMI_412]